MKYRFYLLHVTVVVVSMVLLGSRSRASSLTSQGVTERISVAFDGTESNGHSYAPFITSDGRYVAYGSSASNLVAGDTNYRSDIFVYDRWTGENSRVSLAYDGGQANGSCSFTSISSDGRFVAFNSTASNLVPHDTNEKSDVFVHDRATGETTRVSVATDGTEGNDYSQVPTISSDGRFVAFDSAASSLVPDDTNEESDVFVHDRETGETTRVSVASDGTEGNGMAFGVISADGNYVAFESWASNLVLNDTNNVGDIFVHDLHSGETTRVSVSSDGTEGRPFPSSAPSISADGRFVAFASAANNLVLGDTNANGDVFVHDRQSGETTRVSVATDGTEGNNYSTDPVISADGRYVAFVTAASNLFDADTNSVVDIALHDQVTGTTERVSVASDGTEGDDHSEYPSISGNGSHVAFRSGADNLVTGDTNDAYDVFIRSPNNADFNATPTSGIAPLTVDFNNLSSGEYDNCSWEFGDSELSGSCQDPSHTYNLPGSFTVTLIVNGTRGPDTRIRNNYIDVYEPVIADFSAAPRTGAASLAVDFTNLSSGDYEYCTWNFGDGTSYYSCLGPSHNYSQAGTYTVSLTVSGLGGSDTRTRSDYVTVYEPANADFSAVPRSGVAPLAVDFTNISSGDYDTCDWTFGDGETSDSCLDPTHNYNQAGTYTVSLTVSGLGGSDTRTRSNYITVYESASADFSATPASGAAPLAVDFANLSSGDYDTCDWTFGDGGTSNSCLDPSHSYNQAGTYTVSLTVSGLGGSDTRTRSSHITVYEPASADFSATPTNGVAPLTVDFTNLSSGDYDTCDWDFGDGGAIGNCQDPSHTYSQPGTYTVTLTIGGLGGSDTQTKANLIDVYEPGTSPVADFSATPRSGVAPLAVGFTNLSSGDYDSCLWDYGDGATSEVCPGMSHTYTVPGTYTVTLTVDGPAGADTASMPNYITVESFRLFLPIILRPLK